MNIKRMNHPKSFFAMSLTVLFAATMNAQAKQPSPVNVPAGTSVVCEAYSGQNTITIEPDSNAQTTVLSMSCGIADGYTAGNSRFVAELIGSHDTTKGRAVTAWNQLSFPYVFGANGTHRVTFEINDSELFESREWFDGKLRMSFKRDFVFAKKIMKGPAHER